MTQDHPHAWIWLLWPLAPAIALFVGLDTPLRFLLVLPVVLAPEVVMATRLLRAPTWYARERDGRFVRARSTEHDLDVPYPTVPVALDAVPAAIRASLNPHDHR